MVGLAIVLNVLIICITICACTYMCFCSENKVKMFANPRYNERISELEKRIKKLEECE